ncbi:MAG: caspase family protein, partial [Devosia sp.]
MIARLLGTTALVSLLAVAPALAQDHALKGVALVIGESKYESLTPLTNPQQDARDIDRLLGDLGFDVERVLNADSDELHEAIAEFIADAADADVALVYYSGHGIEVGGQNYLVPVDTDFTSPQSAGEAVVPVLPLLDELAEAVPVTILLLDACRSDPFPAGTVIQLPGDAAPLPVSEEGLAAVRGPTPVAQKEASAESLGSVIGFAAEPGEPALDGEPGGNSPYAAALLKHLSAGGFSFGDIMTMVTEEVYLKTKTKQLPWTNSSLRRVLNFGEPIEANDDADEAAIKGERRKLLLSIATTPDTTRSYVEELAGEEAVPLDALYGMLNVLGVDASTGDLEQQLQSGAARLKDLLARKTDSVKADPELARLSKLAEAAEAEGAIALALKYRDEASTHADSLLANRQVLAAQLRQDMVDIAATYADNAATALLNFEHVHAAELYGKAYDAVKDWDPNAAYTYKLGQGDALYDRGYYTSDNEALVASIDAYTTAEQFAPRDSTPRDWATLQDRKGQSLQALGERVTDSSALQRSIVAYQAALEVRTPTVAAEEWARTQNNIANTYYTIGRRNGDMGMIQQALSAFDASLSVFTPRDKPAKWAMVQSNKSAAQIDLANLTYASSNSAEMAAHASGNPDATNIPEVVESRNAANEIISGALVDLERAVTIVDKAGAPLDWAMLSHTLATGYETRGEMNHITDDLRKAADIYRGVLAVHTRERTPAQWIRTSNNLAITLKKISDETSEPTAIREAVTIYRSVIEATSKTEQPLDWADYQQNLGNALAGLADYEDAVPNLNAALDAYGSAGEITTLDRGASKWQGLQTALSTTLLMRSIKTMNKADAEAAKAIAERTRDTLAGIGVPADPFYSQ